MILCGCRKKKDSGMEGKAVQKKAGPASTVSTQDQSMMESTIHAFRMVETEGRENEDARKVWELVAAEARGETEERVNLSDVTLRFFRENEVVGTITGQTGMFDRKKQSGSMQGDVVGWSSEGYRIETESIQWVKETMLIEAEGMVKIFFGDSEIQGQGLTASVSLKEFKTHNVKGRVVIDEG